MGDQNLGTICNGHVVHADLSKYGAMDKKCLKLAELAAIAIDFPKTGKIVKLPFHLKPKMYPDFMGKEEFQSYENKILGRLYCHVKDGYDSDPTYSESIFASEDTPYDIDLVITGSLTFVDDAWNIKCSCDRQLNGLLGQYKVNREEEIVTGHVWSMPTYSSKKQRELKEKLKHVYNTLRGEFRNVFEHMDSGFDQLSDDEKNAMYEQKASAWYQVTYHPSWMKRSLEFQELDGVSETMMLSFPWIAADYLARIKVKCRGIGSVNSTKPIDSLVRYLTDRI